MSQAFLELSQGSLRVLGGRSSFATALALRRGGWLGVISLANSETVLTLLWSLTETQVGWQPPPPTLGSAQPSFHGSLVRRLGTCGHWSILTAPGYRPGHSWTSTPLPLAGLGSFPPPCSPPFLLLEAWFCCPFGPCCLLLFLPLGARGVGGGGGGNLGP